MTQQQERILQFWKDGMNTVDIARQMLITEAEACRLLHQAMAERRRT